MADRVRRPLDFEYLLTQLKDLKVFSSYKEALVFAACLGFNRGKRVSFTKSSEPIHLTTFSGKYDMMIFDVIAICEAKDNPMMMSEQNSDERIRIFEEYACGGLEILSNEVNNKNVESDLINLILAERSDLSYLEELSGISGI